MSRIRSSREVGFTLIELLMVVLIIGLLAAIAIPTYNGQKTSAKNAAAQSAVRTAVDAANAYYMANGESFLNITPTLLRANEPSLTTGVVTSAAPTPGTSATPTDVYVGQDNASTTGDGTGAAALRPSATVLVICAVSKGDTTYCAQGNASAGNGPIWTYSKNKGAVSGATTYSSAW